MTPGPEVSVIMPTFNDVSYVDSAVLSIVSQSHKDWELLAYDDGSTDGTYQRLKFWAGQDERIKVARPFDGHGHYTDICQQLLADAQGKYIARMDGDDMSVPDRLAAEIEFISKHKEVVALGGLVACIMQSTGSLTTDYPWLKKHVEPAASWHEPANHRLRDFNCLVHSTLLANKAVMIEIGGYDDLFPLEDWDLALKLAYQGEFFVLPKILGLKRQHEANKSRNHPRLEAVFKTVKARHNLYLENLPKVSEM